MDDGSKPCILCKTDLAPDGRFGPLHLETPDAQYGVCYSHLKEGEVEKYGR